MRIAIWVESLLGYGHAVRMSNFLRMLGSYEALILSGSISLSPYLVSLFTSHKLLDLPHLSLSDTTKPYPTSNVSGHCINVIRKTRIEKIEEAIRLFQPSHLVIEHFPFGRHGFADEIIKTIKICKEVTPYCMINCSVRDFGNGQPTQETYRTKMDYYFSLFDRVMVHGRKEIFDLSVIYPQLTKIESKIRYTGYISESESIPYSPDGHCFCDMGGGFNADRFSRSKVMESLGKIFKSNVVLMRGVHTGALSISRKNSPSILSDRASVVTLEDQSKDYLKQTGSALIISRSGYNCTSEILKNWVPTIMIPHQFSFEQQLRSSLVDRLERAVCLMEEELPDNTKKLRKIIGRAKERAASWNPSDYRWMFAEKDVMEIAIGC